MKELTQLSLEIVFSFSSNFLPWSKVMNDKVSMGLHNLFMFSTISQLGMEL